MAITQSYADWSIPATISSTQVLFDVSTSFDPLTGQGLATWTDFNSFPTYSLYMPGFGWSTPSTITNNTSFEANHNVFTSFDTLSQQFLALWSDKKNNGQPIYAFFTPRLGWSTPLPISSTSTRADLDVFPFFDPSSGQFLATWADSNNNNYPTYSLFTPGKGWSPLATIPAKPSSESLFDIYIAFNPSMGQFLATWADSTNHNYPTYSFFTAATGWSSPLTIQIPPSSAAAHNIFTSFNPASGQFLAVWADINNNNYPTYSLYTPGTGWSPPSTIQTPAFSQADLDVFPAFDPGTNQFLATWTAANNSNSPTYALYTPGTGWSPPSTISLTPTFAHFHVFNSFNFRARQFLATWSDENNHFYPTYSFYSFPPQGFAGEQKINNFGVVSERFNALSWQINTGVIQYHLYRNGTLIATLKGTADSYQDHNQPKYKQIYLLVADYGVGANASATITVGGN